MLIPKWPRNIVQQCAMSHLYQTLMSLYSKLKSLSAENQRNSGVGCPAGGTGDRWDKGGRSSYCGEHCSEKSSYCSERWKVSYCRIAAQKGLWCIVRVAMRWILRRVGGTLLSGLCETKERWQADQLDWCLPFPHLTAPPPPSHLPTASPQPPSQVPQPTFMAVGEPYFSHPAIVPSSSTIAIH